MPSPVKDYEDSPLHDGCGGPMVTRPLADDGAWNHRAKDGDRLVCCACGDGIVGTDEQVTQAQRADGSYFRARKEGRL